MMIDLYIGCISKKITWSCNNRCVAKDDKERKPDRYRAIEDFSKKHERKISIIIPVYHVEKYLIGVGVQEERQYKRENREDNPYSAKQT